MRPALLVSLLLLLLVEAQGIRLKQGFISAGHQKFHEEDSSLIKATRNEVGGAVLCKDGHCSGRSRKLMTKTTTTSTSTSKSVKNSDGTEIVPSPKDRTGNEGVDKNEENFPVKSSPVSEHGKVAPEHYPDITDIVGMDYSPARRKPPIHN